MENVDWIYLAQVMIQRQAVANELSLLVFCNM